MHGRSSHGRRHHAQTVSRAVARFTVGAVFCAALASSACNDHALSPYDSVGRFGANDRVHLEVERAIDILFVVDNSGSMCEEQATLQASFQDFVAILADAGVDFRLAVISTDMFDPLEGLGRLRTMPGKFVDNIAHCNADLPDLSYCQQGERRPFLDRAAYDLTRPDEVERLRLDFACMAMTGIDGASMEMGLGAMEAALDSPDAEDFLRPDAMLGVVFVSDENDCSDGTYAGSMGPAAKQGNGACELGRNQEDSPEAACPAGGCVGLLTGRDHFRDQLLRLVAEKNGYLDPATGEGDQELAAEDIFVAAIINLDAGVRYDEEASMDTTWCGGAGTQGYRYQLFAEMFAADRRVIAPICDLGLDAPVDFSEPLRAIADGMVSALNAACLQQPPMTCVPEDTGPDGTCVEDGQCCPSGQACDRPLFEQPASGVEQAYLCSGFRVDVRTRTTVDGTVTDALLEEGIDYHLDIGVQGCLLSTGSPIRVTFARPMSGADELLVSYPRAVLGGVGL